MEEKFSTINEETITYYENNADQFVEETVNADVGELYKRFENVISHGCKILDLGCGSGRDSKFFSEKGYQVISIDASDAMCKKAMGITSNPVYKMKAEDIPYKEEFDAVWACASLLHVSKIKMKDTLGKIVMSLKIGGIMYASWKYGDEERLVGGRYFADYTEETLEALMVSLPNSRGFRHVDYWRCEIGKESDTVD